MIGKAADLFGEKVYGNKKEIEEILENDYSGASIAEANDKIMESLEKNVIKSIVEDTKNKYSDNMNKSDEKQIFKELKEKSQNLINKKFTDFSIIENTIEADKNKELQNRFETNKSAEEIENEFKKKMDDAKVTFKNDLNATLDDFMNDSKLTAVKTVETNIKKRDKNTIEEGVRDHLRGFARTIPSFLMAYGSDEVTLQNFDLIIPDDVFEEVTSITKKQFCFLRDGGDYIDEDTKETKYFEGHLFDEVVFNDSIKEFLDLKKRLADYFEEANTEDIFDYIPAQKTNQIYTPKKVVKRMVDMLESENPGCFDDPDKTFIDLYMKSGLYITEIVKRLYNSEKLKELYPNKNDRLIHIFEKQVFGLAPSEIIYKIATSFILGFDEDVIINKHNFVQLDATPYAKDKILAQKLDEIYGKNDMKSI